MLCFHIMIYLYITMAYTLSSYNVAGGAVEKKVPVKSFILEQYEDNTWIHTYDSHDKYITHIHKSRSLCWNST